MNFIFSKPIVIAVLTAFVSYPSVAQVGVGVKAPKNAEVYFDGSRKMLDEKWTYWDGPRLAASLPIKWFIVNDPVDKGTVVNTNDPAAAGGKYGSADIVTKEKFRDFRLHIEFLIQNPEEIAGFISKTVMKFKSLTATLLRTEWRQLIIRRCCR